MPKRLGLNKHQKAVYKVGEQRVSKAQVEELLTMACSADPDERVEAVKYLCPCHVRTRVAEVWETIFRLMEDPDPRVRTGAWHTIEDGGRPDSPEAEARLERLLQAERDPKVRRFAEITWRQVFGSRLEAEMTYLHLAARPPVRERGKCDFCGESGVFVERDLQTMIPTSDLPRAAWVCANCLAAS